MKKGWITLVIFGGVEGYFYYLNRAGDLEMFFMVWAFFAAFCFLVPLITGSYLGGTALGQTEAARYSQEAGTAAEAMFGGRRGNQKPELTLTSAVVYGFYFAVNVICYILVIL